MWPAVAGRRALGTAGGWLAIATLLFATSSAINATLFSPARLVPDLSIVQELPARRAKVDVIERLGSEQLTYVPYDAPPQVRRILGELANELDSETMRTQLIVTLNPETPISEGQQARTVARPHPHAALRPRVRQQPHPQARRRDPPAGLHTAR